MEDLLVVLRDIRMSIETYRSGASSPDALAGQIASSAAILTSTRHSATRRELESIAGEIETTSFLHGESTIEAALAPTLERLEGFMNRTHPEGEG